MVNALTMAEGDPKLAQTLGNMYTFDPVTGALHARDTTYPPGTSNPYPTDPGQTNYSNTPPKGYTNSDNYYTGGGRRGGSGGGRNQHTSGYRSRDYSLGLGQ